MLDFSFLVEERYFCSTMLMVVPFGKEMRQHKACCFSITLKVKKRRRI
jgi:glutamine amidotransferase-like uncharacterized protein